MATTNPILLSAQEDYTLALFNLNAFATDMGNRSNAEFIAAGGCQRCNGRGWIVTWDTMDAMDGSYHDSATCPDCKGAIRQGAAAYNHSVNVITKYDRFHAMRTPDYQPSEADAQTFAHLDAECVAARAVLDSVREALDPCYRGKTVQVVRGRKVPQGTVGTVFWIGPNKFGHGTRLGIKVGEDTVWMDAANCEGILETVAL